MDAQPSAREIRLSSSEDEAVPAPKVKLTPMVRLLAGVVVCHPPATR